MLAGDDGLAAPVVEGRHEDEVGARALGRAGAHRVRRQGGDAAAARAGGRAWRTGAHARKHAILVGGEQAAGQVVEGLCAHLMELREPDAHALVHVHGERDDAVRGGAQTVDMGAHVGGVDCLRARRLDHAPLGGAFHANARQALFQTRRDAGFHALHGRRGGRRERHAHRLAEPHRDRPLHRDVRRPQVVDVGRLGAAHAEDAVACAHGTGRTRVQRHARAA